MTLTATASVASTAKWTPPAAAGTTSVTSATSAAATHPASKSASPAPAAPLPPLPLGAVPNLNAVASQLISAGNAAGLFPAIDPSATPSASQVADPPQASQQDAGALITASPVSAGSPVFTAQVAGLIALGLAIMLTVTRLSRRKRSGSGRTGS